MRFCIYYSVSSFIVLTTSGTGQFYVGLTGVYNATDIYTCEDPDSCRLPVKVEVRGLNSFENSTWTSLLRLTTSDNEEIFQADPDNNPVSFQFHRWPGDVSLTVYIYDSNSTDIIDEITTNFTLYGSNDFFLGKLSQETLHGSTLQVVYRYRCDPTSGPSCFSDCVDHDINETCPTTPTPTQLPPDVITYTGFSDPKCHITDDKGKVISVNCTTLSVPTSTATENTTDSANSTNEVDLTSTTKSVVSRIYFDNGSTFKPTQSQQNVSESINTTDYTTEKHTKHTSISTEMSSPKSEISTQKPMTSQRVPVTVIVQEHPESKTEWAAIVGGVLGGVALLAAAGFLCYWNRQRKMLKRQEIYNVNPKILRNFEEFEENGTTGRADVPMETEQY